MAGMNQGYANNSSGGEFWHTGAYVNDIKEIMYYARLLEAWLGHDPVTTLIVEDFPGVSPVWMRLSAKDGHWDTSVYGSTAPTIFDVADRVRGDGLGLSSYSFTQRVPAYLNCIQARDELQQAIGAPIAQRSGSLAGWMQVLRRHKQYNCSQESWQSGTRDYEAQVVGWTEDIGDPPLVRWLDEQLTDLFVFRASGYWAECESYLVFTDGGGVTYTGTELGEKFRTSGIKYFETVTPNYQEGDQPENKWEDYSDVPECPGVTEEGMEGTKWNCTTTLSGLTPNKYCHLTACILNYCDWGLDYEPGNMTVEDYPFEAYFDWSTSTGDAVGCVWGIP